MQVSWQKIDFQLNARYWNQWGNDSALPFRIWNLQAVMEVFASLNIAAALHGTTERHAKAHQELLADHDDDISFLGDYGLLRAKVLPVLEELGFSKIRDNQLVSVARWGRYIDFHPREVGEVEHVRVNGLFLPVSAGPNPDLPNASKEKRRVGLRKKALDSAVRLKKATMNPLATVGGLIQSTGVQISRFAKRPNLAVLSETEFLNLKLDTEDSINWNWRGNHLRQVAKPGMILGEILENARNGRPFEGVIETAATETFDEPIALSRSFWHTGNNFFVAPLRAGFRHLVIPYHASNLYIRHIKSPELYTRKYFNSLTPMTPEEVRSFLSTRPLESTHGALTSGRHRAMAMLGHLLMGNKYEPVTIADAS